MTNKIQNTSINITFETWQKLTYMKTRPSETFEEVIIKLIKQKEESKWKN